MGDSLRGLVDSLIGRSEMESKAGTERASALEALEDLSHLSRLTESSFEVAAPPVVVSAPSAAVSSPDSTPSVQVSEKYQDIAALQDRGVLEALLDYHRLREPKRGVKAAPVKAPSTNATSPESPAPVEARASQAPVKFGFQPPVKSAFQPAEVPVVDQLHAKNQAGRSLRASQPTSSVLRSKRP